jgi:hypothetical protein
MKKLSPDITDEELNELFREAAGAWPAVAGSAQKDAGWEKMQAKLAAVRDETISSSRTGHIRRRSKLVMVLLLWAMMVTCWMMQPAGKKTAQENKISGSSNTLKSSGATIAEKELSKPDPGPAEKRNSHQPLRKEKETSSGQTSDPSGAALVPGNSGLNPAENEQKIAEQDNALHVRARPGSDAAENKEQDTKQNKQQDAVQDTEESEQHITGLNNAGIIQNIPQHPERFAASGDSITGSVINSRDMLKNLPVQKRITENNAPDSKTKAKEEKQKNKSGFARWAVGLTLGPDWSMVAGKSQTRPGLDKGIMIQYRISRKWSLETGVLLASKLYSARPEDYHSVNPYPNATGINASCQVIDLPLNIRYNIWQPKKEQVFVVAGLSSFWMQKESYLFTYDANAASATSETNIYHQNRHLLSIANMALGYEHAWGNISIQASPYIKIPLAGIGYGRVKLFSTGVLASVKYNF